VWDTWQETRSGSAGRRERRGLFACKLGVRCALSMRGARCCALAGHARARRSARERHTSAHKDDAYPQRRVSRRDAHKYTLELRKSQARTADRQTRAPSCCAARNIQLDQQVLFPERQQCRRGRGQRHAGWALVVGVGAPLRSFAMLGSDGRWGRLKRGRRAALAASSCAQSSTRQHHLGRAAQHIAISRPVHRNLRAASVGHEPRWVPDII
jgi:hypothetical protein